jgi:hypothetical protein
MFYEYRDCDMLNFYIGDNIDNISQKSEFQYNYNLLYFYYVISLFKKSNFYVCNLTPDHLLFDELPKVQKNDPIIYKHYVDSIFYLKHLVKTFKSLIKVNDNII